MEWTKELGRPPVCDYEFGCEGEEEGSFRSPARIHVHAGEIFITDEFNHRVQVFDEGTCEFVRQIKVKSPDTEERLRRPYGVAISVVTNEVSRRKWERCEV